MIVTVDSVDLLRAELDNVVVNPNQASGRKGFRIGCLVRAIDEDGLEVERRSYLRLRT